MADEIRLLRRLQNREERALQKAIELYTPYLSTVLYRAVGNALSREDMEEILSDVFVSLWQGAERIHPERGTIRSYMAATARNMAYKRLRSFQPVMSLEDLQEVPETLSGISSERLLWDSVAELGEQDFEIFVRYYKYGQSLREIAAAMEMKLSTVKTRLSRGKRKLKTILVDAEGMQ